MTSITYSLNNSGDKDVEIFRESKKEYFTIPLGKEYGSGNIELMIKINGVKKFTQDGRKIPEFILRSLRVM